MRIVHLKCKLNIIILLQFEILLSRFANDCMSRFFFTSILISDQCIFKISKIHLILENPRSRSDLYCLIYLSVLSISTMKQLH